MSCQADDMNVQINVTHTVLNKKAEKVKTVIL